MSDYEFTMSLRIRHPHAEPALDVVLEIKPYPHGVAAFEPH
jgi:hypothetical protein